MPRFVVLRHEPSADYERGLHWDLMLEHGESLLTWALSSLPLEPGPIKAEQLPDHRKVYLEYEGPVSGNRGNVSRWDEGEFEFIRQSTEEIVVRLDGEQVCGTIKLVHDSAGSKSWHLEFLKV